MSRRIERILIANRGEIASRVMRTARALGISTVAVHSDVDARAPYVLEADRAVHLPGVTSAETYLAADRIIEAALVAGADAIHPGYGFLSENPGFARAVQHAGLTWIGPSPENIEAMALKIEARRLALAADVPLVPGAVLGEAITEAELLGIGADVGYPLLVKASAGGGGKGMRIVRSEAELVEAIAGARREARSAFGDDTVFIERYLAGARHIEVQVFGDMHGHVVHLFERECSIQRRHQKVIEEAPSPGVTQAVRERLHDSAQSLARKIGYVGAGTVEFLVAGEGQEQECFFLEMNTRLQVEHPVTEFITGIDLVAWQIAIAQGEPLPMAQAQISARGHAIEARLYAEDPAHDFLPASGLLNRFRWQPRDGLRVDSGVTDGTVITPHYDPMLAKVIMYAPEREVAARLLADSLARMQVHGPVTNRDSLVAILRSPDFLDGLTPTDFLDSHPEVTSPQVQVDDEIRHALAVAFAQWAVQAPSESVPFGWRNVPGVPEFVSLLPRGREDVVTVLHDAMAGRVQLARTAEPPYSRVFDLPAEEVVGAAVHVALLEPDHVLATVTAGGVTARCHVHIHAGEAFVDDGLASTAWTIAPRFIDHSQDAVGHGPATKVPGTITAVQVTEGQAVVAGQVLVVLEAMKMEHAIRADADGVVEKVHVSVGQSVDAHTVVVDLVEEAGDA